MSGGKCAKYMTRLLPKEYKWRNMILTSLVIKEMQINTEIQFFHQISKTFKNTQQQEYNT